MRTDTRTRSIWVVLAVMFVGSASAALLNPGFSNGLSPWSLSDDNHSQVLDSDFFQISDAPEIIVEPYWDRGMLRLGDPLQPQDSPAHGTLVASQRFNSTEALLPIAVRLFSYEFGGRLASDALVIRLLQDGVERSLPVYVSDRVSERRLGRILGETQASAFCAQTPCVLRPARLDRLGPFDSGWVTGYIHGLPTDGSTLEIRYELVNNDTNPTWAYVDTHELQNAADTAIGYFNAGPLPFFAQTNDASLVTVVNSDVDPQTGASIFPLSPYASMVRMGEPVANEFDPVSVGSLTFEQTFVPSTPFVELQLAIFSFETFGGDDILIELIDPQNPNQVFSVSNGPFDSTMNTGYGSLDPSCDFSPCLLRLVDSPRNGSLERSSDVDRESAFLRVRFDGLSQKPNPLTLRVTLTNDSTASTWVYLNGPDWSYPSNNDPANQRPSAVIDFYPGEQPNSLLLEGDFTVFDCTNSTDPENDPLTCTWTVSGNTVPPESFVGNYLVYTFPDNDPGLLVELEVSDGTSRSVQEVTPPVLNAAPVINLLSAEVLDTGSVRSICRYADPGWGDDHSVQISIDGAPVATITAQEDTPSFASGVGYATIEPAQLNLGPGQYGLECAVSDDDGATTVDSATLTVLASADVDSKEAADTTAGLNQIAAGQTIIARIDSRSDMDLYQILNADGTPVVAGSEVNVIVDVPGDYDAVLLSDVVGDAANAPFVNAPFVNVPFVNVPFVNVPFVNVPFVNVPFVNAPFVNVPFVNAPFVNAPFVNAPFVNAPLTTSPWLLGNFVFENLPLSQVGLAAPPNDTVAGSDVSIADFPALDRARLDALDAHVRAISGNRSTRREHMLIRVTPGEQALYLAIVPGSKLAYDEPYKVSVEVSFPPNQSQVLAEACMGAPLIPAAQQTNNTAVLHASGNPTTLIVTQAERYRARHGLSQQQFNEQLITPLQSFFNHPAVNAKVISVPSTLFNDADTNPCIVAEQNAAAQSIADIIRAERQANPSIEYVQIIGGPDVIPNFQLPDEVQVGYEALYATELLIEPASPVAVGIAEGYNPSDAPYVDDKPLPFRGRELYIEDIPIARLVEEPGEIVAAGQEFVAINGELPVTEALAFGYDFFIDGTEASAKVLSEIATVTTIAADDWDAESIRQRWLNPDGSGTEYPLAFANGHATYFAMVSALGFATENYGDIIVSNEPAVRVPGQTSISIGCHTALSVPDSFELFEDWGTDWVQEPGGWVGPMTYGLGDTVVADRGTEGIVTLIGAELIDGYSLGEAIVRAKLRYSLGLFEFDPHDEKSVVGLALFGMPQLRLAGIPVAQVDGIEQMQTPEPVANLFSGWKLQTVAFDPTIDSLGTAAINFTFDGGTTVLTPDLDRRTIPLGEWYTYDELAQGVVARTLQPVVRPFELLELDGSVPRTNGVILRGGLYTDFLDRDPVFATPAHDWVTVDEPQACVEAFTPSALGAVATTTNNDVTYQTMIVHGGQFQCTSEGAPTVRGTQRIYDQLDIEASHPNDPANTDLEPPQILSEDLLLDTNTGDITATLNAIDASGIREIVVVLFEDDDGVPGGTGTATSVTTGIVTGLPAPYVLVLPDAAAARLMIQYVGNDGTVSVSTGKGHLLAPVTMAIASTSYQQGPTDLTVDLGDVAGSTDATLTLEFGDGTAQTVEVFDADGVPGPETTVVGDDATVTVTHDYSAAPATGVVLRALYEAPGSEAEDEQLLTLNVPAGCSDPAGDASDPSVDIVACDANASGSQLNFALDVGGATSLRTAYFVTARFSDGAVQHEVSLRYWFGRLFAYVDGQAQLPAAVGASAGAAGATVNFSFDASTLGWNGTAVDYEFQAVLRSRFGSIVDQTAPATLP